MSTTADPRGSPSTARAGFLPSPRPEYKQPDTPRRAPAPPTPGLSPAQGPASRTCNLGHSPPPAPRRDTVMRGWGGVESHGTGRLVIWPPSADHPALRSLRLREGLPNKRVRVASWASCHPTSPLMPLAFGGGAWDFLATGEAA